MAKLSKAQIKAHNEAVALVDSDRPLKDDEKEFVFDNWQESAVHINSAAGAFFTPRGLARDLAFDVGSGRIVDLCAGIGALAYHAAHKATALVCVEINPHYARIGKRLVPEAQWVVASIFDPAVEALGRFDSAISNPPFGNIRADEFRGFYSGSAFELKALEVASRIADSATFLLPQASTPFRFSGHQCYSRVDNEKLQKFEKQTGITMEMGCGVDTSFYRNDWKGVSPLCEIVCCDFPKPQPPRQDDLFSQQDGGRNA